MLFSGSSSNFTVGFFKHLSLGQIMSLIYYIYTHIISVRYGYSNKVESVLIATRVMCSYDR